MQFSVPCLFSESQLVSLSRLNDEARTGKVAECYGSLNPSLFGSGRITRTLPPAPADTLVKIVARAREYGLTFNYTLNQACMGGEEFSAEGRKRVLRFVEFLSECGIRSVTVAIPFLIELIARRFPEIEVCASAILRIDSIDKAMQIEDLGAERLILFEDLNRDFFTISRIRERVSASLEIMVNSPCLFSCPFREYHYTAQGHANGADGLSADTWFVLCNLRKLKHPEVMIKARGPVRPEDLTYYAQAGIDFAKIVGREVFFDNLSETARAYLSGEFDGNLFDLLPRREGTRQAFSIQNKDLAGFLDYFRQGKNPCSRGCFDCGYCDEYAERIELQVSGEQLEKAKRELETKMRERWNG